LNNNYLDNFLLKFHSKQKGEKEEKWTTNQNKLNFLFFSFLGFINCFEIVLKLY